MTLQEWSNTLTKILLFFPIIPITAGLLRYPNLKTPFLFLFYYILISPLFDLVGYPLALQKTNNLWVYNLYNMFQFNMLGFVFAHLMQNQSVKRVIPYIQLSLTLIMIVNFVWVQGFFAPNSYSRALSAIFILSCSTYTLYEFTQDIKTDSYLRSPLFLLCCGCLIYFSGTFFLFLLNNMNEASRFYNFPFYMLHQPLRMLLNTFYFVTFLCIQSRNTTS